MHANGVTGLADVDIINHLDMISAKKVKYDTTTSKAAELLISEEDDEEKDNCIVTPWDIVMKTVKLDHMLTAAN
jgi:hypothetical protein